MRSVQEITEVFNGVKQEEVEAVFGFVVPSLDKEPAYS